MSIEKKKDEYVTSFKGSNFLLKDMNNNIITQESFKGPLTAIFFGFTNCPDVCPMTLNKMDIVLDKLENQVEQLTDQLDVVVNQSTQKLKGYVEESGEALSNSMKESGQKFSNALNKASDEMDLPTDFFTNQLKEPLINMKDQINSFNSELTEVIKSQGTIARNTEKVSQVVEKLAVKMDLTDKMPDYVEVIENSVNEINSITVALNNTYNKINEISQSFDEVVEGEKTKLSLTNEMRGQMASDLEFLQDYKKEMKDALTKSTQYIELLKSELTEAAALIVKKLG